MNFFKKLWRAIKPYKEPVTDYGIDFVIGSARKGLFKLIEKSGKEINKTESKNWINHELHKIQEKLDKWL